MENFVKNKFMKKAVSLVASVGVLFSTVAFTYGAGTQSTQSTENTQSVQDPKVIDATENISYFVNAINNNYVDGKNIDYTKLKIGALKGMLATLDPYSEYMEPSEYTTFKQAVDGKLVGIGVVLITKNNKISIDKVLKNSPAQNAGLRAGDVFYSINGVSASKYKNASELSSKVRGEEGTIVNLTMLRNGSKYEVSIKRASINILSVEYSIKENNIGYLAISQIGEDTYNQFKEAEDFFKKKGVKKVVLDMRDNGGGYLSVASSICQDIIPKGLITTLYYANEPTQTVNSTLSKAPFKLAVLINENTASAAELISGAIQDRKVGKLIGEKSYGKGVMQVMYGVEKDENGDIYFSPLTQEGSLGSIKLTVGKYNLPTGRNINKVGLKPDVECKYPNVYQYDGTKAFVLKNMNYSKFKAGKTGTDIASLETKLKLLGYLKQADDKYDIATTEAVNKYQHNKKFNLKLFGLVNEKTLKYLDADIKALSKKDLQLEAALKSLQ